MNEKYFRIYKKLNFDDVREHLLIYGDLSASCSKCKALDIKLDATQCPSCQTPFKYIAFRNVKQHWPKLSRIMEARPEVFLVDFDDYMRIMGQVKAEEFLK